MDWNRRHFLFSFHIFSFIFFVFLRAKWFNYFIFTLCYRLRSSFMVCMLYASLVCLSFHLCTLFIHMWNSINFPSKSSFATVNLNSLHLWNEWLSSTSIIIINDVIVKSLCCWEMNMCIDSRQSQSAVKSLLYWC